MGSFCVNIVARIKTYISVGRHPIPHPSPNERTAEWRVGGGGGGGGGGDLKITARKVRYISTWARSVDRTASDVDIQIANSLTAFQSLNYIYHV